jgi:hypothetical protein
MYYCVTVYMEDALCVTWKILFICFTESEKVFPFLNNKMSSRAICDSTNNWPAYYLCREPLAHTHVCSGCRLHIGETICGHARSIRPGENL